MAYLPRMSLFGQWIGLTRETTNGTGLMFFAKRGLAAPYLVLHATEPTANSTSSLVDIEGLTTVTSQTTADTALSVRGISVIPAGASTLYTLAGPAAPGVRKAFWTSSTSTALRQVKSAASVIVGAAVGGASGTVAASSQATILSFTGQGNYLELMALSTSAWAAVNLQGFSTGATPVTS